MQNESMCLCELSDTMINKPGTSCLGNCWNGTNVPIDNILQPPASSLHSHAFRSDGVELKAINLCETQQQQPSSLNLNPGRHRAADKTLSCRHTRTSAALKVWDCSQAGTWKRWSVEDGAPRLWLLWPEQSEVVEAPDSSGFQIECRHFHQPAVNEEWAH